MIKNPAIEITVKSEHFSCTAKQVSDDELRQRILTLRDSASRMDRVVFGMAPEWCAAIGMVSGRRVAAVGVVCCAVGWWLVGVIAACGCVRSVSVSVSC